MDTTEAAAIPSAYRSKRILWIEFAVGVSYGYLFEVLGQWLPHTEHHSARMLSLFRLSNQIGLLLPLLFIVLVADGNLDRIGFRRPVWKIDALVTLGLAVFMYLVA